MNFLYSLLVLNIFNCYILPCSNSICIKWLISKLSACALMSTHIFIEAVCQLLDVTYLTKEISNESIVFSVWFTALPFHIQFFHVFWTSKRPISINHTGRLIYVFYITTSNFNLKPCHILRYTSNINVTAIGYDWFIVGTTTCRY